MGNNSTFTLSNNMRGCWRTSLIPYTRGIKSILKYTYKDPLEKSTRIRDLLYSKRITADYLTVSQIGSSRGKFARYLDLCHVTRLEIIGISRYLYPQVYIVT